MRVNVREKCIRSVRPESNLYLKESALFVLVTVMPPGLNVAMVPDSVVVSTGRVRESLGAIRTRVGFLSSAIYASSVYGRG